MFRSMSFAFILFIIAIPGWSQEVGKDWPQINGFADRLSYSPVTYGPPFELDKTVETGLFIESYTYADGVVYIASPSGNNENKFGAFDLTTQQVLWTFDVPNTTASVGFHPAVSGNLVYVGGQHGRGLYALDKMTGDSVWFSPVGPLFGRNVAIEGDLLYVNSSSGGLTCLNKMTGERRWDFSDFSPQNVCPVDSGQVYLYQEDTIYALNRFDGSINWKMVPPFPNNNFSMLVHQDRLVVKSRQNLAIFDVSDGTVFKDTTLTVGNGTDLAWNMVTYTPDSYLILDFEENSDSFGLHRILQENLEVVWRDKLAPRSWGSAVAFGEFFVLVNGGNLEVRLTESGEVIQFFDDQRYHNVTRPKVTDFGLLATSDSRISIFRPVITNLDKRTEEIPFSWKVLQNPGNGKVQFEITADQQMDLHYQLMDIQGRKVTPLREANVMPGTQLITLKTQVPAGMYVLALSSGKHRYAETVVLK